MPVQKPLLLDRLRELLGLLWMLMLILPAATSTSSSQPWDIDSRILFGLSCWLVVMPRLLLPANWFFPLSFPAAWVGVACMGADALRHADLLDLALQWQTFSRAEVLAVLEAYSVHATVATAALAAWCWASSRRAEPRRTGPSLALGTVAATALLSIVLPGVAWIRSWPLNAGLVAASVATHSQELLSMLQPALSTVDPRNPAATWNGRATSTAPRQTLVFIIGESVRADFLRECQGPTRVRGLPEQTLIACDVTSGSDATHTSVPLLISRDMPGRPYRVSTDGTFQQAFREAGFETHWIGDQGSSLAWPDAEFQSYPDYAVADEKLHPALAAALARPASHKAIVLHAYNAHEPYCTRFDRATAPYPVDCSGLLAPLASDAVRLREAYADAVDSTVGTLGKIIEVLRQQPGEAFLLFTPDHGENLFDDSRQLYGHAMRTPTRWDTHVPAIFWANEAWRSAHPRQWANLRAQMTRPLMHADMVPSFLAAAGVRYDENRSLAINLLDAQTPPSRERTVQRALGATVTWETLVRDAL